MKTPLGTEVDLGAGHIVLDRFPALRERGTAPPSFRHMSIVATVAHLSYCWALVKYSCIKRVTGNSSEDEIASVNFYTTTSSTTFTQYAPEATIRWNNAK